MLSKTLSSKAQDTRLKLIEVGTQMITENGFNNTGISEVLKAVGVPKGSFYHYFESKDDFGIQIINHFCDEYFKALDQDLNNESLSPLNRLMKNIDCSFQEFGENDYRCGCLFGNLGQEMASQSEIFRARLEEAFNAWLQRIEALFELAKATGEIDETIDCKELAEFYVNAIEGTIIRCKVLKSDMPIKVFNKMFYRHICSIKSA